MSTTNPECPFPETADIHTSSDEYAGRFAGPAGQWMLSVQERITLRLLRPSDGLSVLDVGGGHGQLAHPLVREGYRVAVLGSDASCAHRIQSLLDAGTATFAVGNVIDLPYPDKSFDSVVCFRLLTHCDAWPTLVRELCRVARRAVVVDYPTSQSLNAIAPAFFGAKKKFEKNTRTWTLFRHAQITQAFADAGFRRAATRKQFALPMVVHRMLKNRALSASAEAVCRAVGLTALAGSPVIARFEPVAPAAP
jgi:ubiquinone/menaquinone biosynthesis C-methylase UbiE